MYRIIINTKTGCWRIQIRIWGIWRTVNSQAGKEYDTYEEAQQAVCRAGIPYVYRDIRTCPTFNIWHGSAA